MRLLCYSLLIFSYAHAFTLNNNVSAGFSQDEVKVYVAETSDCSNITGMDNQDIVNMIGIAVREFWNTVPSSRLRLKSAGIYSTTDTNFADGILCNYYAADYDDMTDCLPAMDRIPQVHDVIFSCNTNGTDNFQGMSGYNPGILAETVINNFNGTNIKGSVILINSASAMSGFNSLSYAQKISVIAHEIGHAIGLGHSPVKASLMYFAVVPTRNSLGQDDIDGVTYLYPKQFDGCGALSISGSSHTDDGPGPWNFLLSFFLGALLVISGSYRKRPS
jgi:hypothetical protein